MQRLRQQNQAAILRARRKHAKTCSNDAGYDLITVPKVRRPTFFGTCGTASGVCTAYEFMCHLNMVTGRTTHAEKLTCKLLLTLLCCAM